MLHMSDSRPPRARSPRMTGRQRREQLVVVGRSLFAQKGYNATSVEEVAAKAGVSKPIVYEHFEGKEGLYAVIVDRETDHLLRVLEDALHDVHQHPRVLVEKAALAFLTYIEENEDGFQILVRDSPASQTSGTYSALLVDVASQVEDLLVRHMRAQKYTSLHAAMYAQMLVGIVSYTGQWWLETRRPSKEVVASHIVNLAWNGLRGLESEPRLLTTDRHSKKK